MLSFASDFRPLFWAFIGTGAFRPAWFKRSSAYEEGGITHVRP